ncbi:MAG: M3 family metallopeptidase [Brumimicrobium sp.]
MRKYALSLFAVLALSVACTDSNDKTEDNQKSKTIMENPFIEESTLDFKVPDFSKIKDTDYEPAFEEGIRQKLEEIEAIANNEEEPTFENTLIALEKSGQMLTRVQRVFYLLAGANFNDEIKRVEELMAPKLASLSDAVFLNDNLFQKVKAIHEQRDKFEGEDQRLIDYYYQKFVLSGAELSSDDKEVMKELNSRLATLTTQFSNMLVNASNNAAYLTDNVENLAGLSEGAIKAAANDAELAGEPGKWLLPQLNTTQQPPLTNLTNREVRKEIYKNSLSRAEKGDENDTREIIVEIAQIRAKQAQLLGFESYTEWNVQDQMAQTPQAIDNFFAQLVPPSVKAAQREAEELQKTINAEGADFELKAWDWNFYAEKLRKEKYDLDEEAIMPYFELNNVLENGVFYSANLLFGLTFSERTDIPVYHEDVKVYDVFDKDGSQIGLFYADFFMRSNKRGGAWMSNIVGQSYLLGTQPVIYNVCNFPKPADGQPALLTWDNVVTLFHEFGHSLHGFFASQNYPSLSGTRTPRDFVELPSQFNEHCAIYPSILANYAKHYETGEAIPVHLIDKIKKSSTFNEGYRFTELLAAANLDLEWHSISADEEISDASEFERKALESRGLYSELVPPRYRSTYFNHIFGGGYAAGYYAYLWTDMLNQDAFAWFEENGGLTPENGQRYRDMILSIGNSKDLAQAYKDFVGREASIKPLLKSKGM